MNILVSFPSIVEKYGSYFRSCFSEEGFIHFKKAVSGYIISDNKTLSAINRMFTAFPRDQSSFNRFYNQQNFDLDAINEARLNMLQSKSNTRIKLGRTGGVLGLDNSLLKHYGKHFDNIYYHFDYVHKCFRWSHDLVTLYYSDAQTDYPLFWQLWQPPNWEEVAQFFRSQGYTINENHWNNRDKAPRKWRNYIRSRYSTGRIKYPKVLEIYKTKLHIGADLLRAFKGKHPEKHLPIALDSGFTSPELCDIIRIELKMDYVGSLREDQKVADKSNGQMILLSTLVQRLRMQQKDPTEPSLVQKTGFTYRGKKHYCYTYCANFRISKYAKKQRLVISFLKEDLTDRPNFSISNRLDWNASGILRIRRHRWPVETYHQEGKVEGLEAYQTRNYKAIQTHIALITVAFSMLKFLSHDDDLLSKIQQRLQTETDTTLPALRRLLNAEGLFNLLEYMLVKYKQGHTLQQIFQPIAKCFA